MAKTRILITVKTYPTISKKYDELVCTAGFTEDGKWIRLYPIPYRKLDYINQYKKYDWVEVDLERSSDFRPESHKLVNVDVEEPIKVVGHLDTRNNWAARKEVVLNRVYTDLKALIEEAKNKAVGTSLAVFKPTVVHDFIWKEVDREWEKSKQDQLLQMKLFEENSDFEVVKKLPYKFSYRFDDENGVESTQMIEDWETGALFWNQFKKYGDEKKACESVRQKYMDDFARTKDLYFFLGTTMVNHYRAPNPFIIIGTFTPKIESQLSINF
ncbi:MAG: hypothetical protein H6601_11105 [Flavobacteriales bacterium]|nr:hypothetical protein [Flavobacteriales bacterium]MCB9203877.1 hypothetical protein [Flavobacteriales bacterium]